MSDIQTIFPGPISGRTAINRPFRRLSFPVGAILREPLLHFLVLGAALFVLWAAFGDRLSQASDRIVISAGQMGRSIDTFSRTHLRAPDKDELQGLVDQEIRDEVYFREGMALGLDRNDEIIRRRIRQKMLFLTQDIADQQTPSEAELQAYLDQHRGDYGGEPSIVFSQVYLNPDRHKDIAADAARLRDRLNRGDGRIDYAAVSDTLPVSNDFEATPAHVVASVFGHDFETAIAGQPEGRWVGPIQSGYGMHLVLIRERKDPKPPVLSDVRDDVLRNWQADRRAAVNEAAYRQMLAHYKIKVELPSGPLNAAAAPADPGSAE